MHINVCMLQAIDLRWGIRDESQDDHTTIDLCLQEIENCQKSSIGPSFVVSLRHCTMAITLSMARYFFSTRHGVNYII